MIRCAICGNLLEEESMIQEEFTGSELEVCRECNSKLEAVMETAQELDDSNYTAACDSLMQDEKRGRSEAATKLLDTYCKKCKNPDYDPTDTEPNSFIEQIQEAMEEEEKEKELVERTLEKSKVGLITRILGLLVFIGGTLVSIFLGFEYRHISINYLTASSAASYNYAIAIFGSMAFFICGLIIMAVGEYLYQQNLRTQMMERLYYKIFDKIDE